ncbi:hypothetical protein H2O64_14700 [Kordia sp. YSTF-M3]|uniref:Bacteriocin n=1 Tax=Kordia aestuariivivens TaxID=2759037 RepID=A0ABR7QBI4_9FLAO|nr:hypothetical protein [Kordia aestuariivivens]MBC8755925.1 hypothetical protein [Kordia aestuariivivens]
MKKVISKSLVLNKKSISKLDRLIIEGGKLDNGRTSIPVGICTCNLSCHSCPECPTEK